MTLRTQYTAGLLKLGFVQIDSRSTKYSVFQGTTSQLYNVDPKVSNEPRWVFVSTRGSSIRIGRSPKVTDHTMVMMQKTKDRLISLSNQ